MCLGMGGWPAGPVVCCAGRTARNMGGKVQEGFGRVTGDAKSQADGLINQATGAAQDLYRQAKDVNPRSILIRLVCGRLDRELLGTSVYAGTLTFSRARRRSPCDSGSVTRSARSIPPRVCIKVITRGAEPNPPGERLHSDRFCWQHLVHSDQLCWQPAGHDQGVFR